MSKPKGITHKEAEIKRKAVISLYKNGFTQKEIQTALGYTDYYVKNILKDNDLIPRTESVHHIRYEKSEWISKVVELRKNGMTYVAIEKELGISRETIRRWLTELGMNKKQTNKKSL
jgi:DNA invertase Pin-like site-specific DNA recombinase